MLLQSSSPVSSGNSRPITQAELTQLLADYSKSFNQDMGPKIDAAAKKVAELNKQKQMLDKQQEVIGRQKESLDKQQEVLDKQKEALDKQKEAAINGVALGRAMKASAQVKLEQADRLTQEADKLKQEAAREKLEIAKLKQDLLTNKFHSIFNKTPLPSEAVDNLFKRYLADGSLTVEKSQEGKSFPQINSMKSVTQYLTDHPDVKSCDFRVFKTAINDIPTLATYLKKSTVKAIALSSDISAEAKASLAEAVAARNGNLKVQYFS